MTVLHASDRTQETALNIGLTTPITLLGAAAPGLQSFQMAGLDGEIVPYTIEHEATGQWEVGSGEYVAATHTLNRTTIYSSSSGGLVNFANGVVDVWVDLPSEKAVMLDADSSHLTLPAGLSIAGALDGVTTLLASGAATLQNTLGVTGATTLQSTLHAQGATTLDSTLVVGTSITPAVDNTAPLGTAAKRWSDIRAMTATLSGLLTAAAGATISAAQTLALAGAIVSGAPTWSSAQAITLSTASQPNVTTAANLVTVGALASGSIAVGFGNINNAGNSITTGALVSTTAVHAGNVTPSIDNTYALGTASFRWSDLRAMTATFSSAVTMSSTLAIGGFTYTFPGSQPANAFLQTNGSGTLSWVTESAGISLASLSDVTLSSNTNGQALIYNSATSKWNNSFVSLLTGLGTVTVGTWAAGAVSPAVDNTSALGTASFRWADVRAVTGTFAGLLTASLGLTVASGQTLTLTGATVAGAPTWISNQAITLSTASQPNVTTMANLTTIGTLVAGAVPASLVTAGTFGAGNFVVAGTFTPSVDNSDTLGSASFRWSDLRAVLATFSGVVAHGGTASFTAANPFSVTNGQVLTVATTSQTVGAATLTLPNFASVSDTFAFITLAQTLSNKTLSSPTLSGTVAGTPTIASSWTWSSNQPITLSTAAQPNVTSLGTLAANLIFVDATYDIGASGATRARNLFLSSNITAGGTITSGLINGQTISSAANFTGSVTVASGFTVSAGTSVVQAFTATTGIFTGNVTPSADNTYALGTASKRWNDLQSMTGTFAGAVVHSSTLSQVGTMTVGTAGGAWILQGTSASGSNVAAGNMTLIAPLSTGTGTPASIVFQIGVTGTTGGTVQSAASALELTALGPVFNAAFRPVTLTAIETNRASAVWYGDGSTSNGLVARFVNAGAGATIQLNRYNGTPSAPTAIVSTNNIGNLGFLGYDGSATAPQQGVIITATATENWNGTSHGTKLTFTTTPNTTTTGVIALTLDQDQSGIFAGIVRPAVDNSKALGTASFRWSDFQSVTGTFGGALTGTTAAFSSSISAVGPSSGVTAATFTGFDTAASDLIVFQRLGGAVRGRIAYDGTALNIGSSTNHNFNIITNGATVLTILNTGGATFSSTLAATVATFSGNVTAGDDTGDKVVLIRGAATSGNGARVQYMRGGASIGYTGSVASIFGGTANDMMIMAVSGGQTYLGSNGSLTWQIPTAGHFLANTDNTYDIGASGASRPRNLFIAGQSVLSGSIGIGQAAQANVSVGIAQAGAGLTGTSQFGLAIQGSFASSATVAGAGIYSALGTQSTSFTMATGYGILIDAAFKGAGSTITTLYGLFIGNQTVGGTNYALFTNTGTVQFGDGVVVGAATGGNKGAGTINVSSAVYLNGTAYTNPDYVFELLFTGKIEKHAKNRGADEFKLRTLAEVEAICRDTFKLPAFTRDGLDLFRGGDALLESVESAYGYLFDHEKRLAMLEAKQAA